MKYTRHAVGQSAYHFVWRPRYNVKVFMKEFPRKVAEQAIREVALKYRIEIIELGVMPDHVHCFTQKIPATLSVA